MSRRTAKLGENEMANDEKILELIRNWKHDDKDAQENKCRCYDCCQAMFSKMRKTLGATDTVTIEDALKRLGRI